MDHTAELATFVSFLIGKRLQRRFWKGLILVEYFVAVVAAAALVFASQRI